MSFLVIVSIIFFVGYVAANWYKNDNKNIMEDYLKNKNNDYIFIEHDNSKAIGIEEKNRIINLYSINDDDSVKEVSYGIDQVNDVDVKEDDDSDQKCKYIRLNIYINDKSDNSLSQIIFLAPTWTMDGHDGYQHSSDKYLQARQQANKFKVIINSMRKST